MAVNLTYDPSNDPETIEAEEQRDVESLEIGEKLAEEQDQLLAGKYKDAEDLEKAYIELQKKLGENESEPKEDTEETPESKDDSETEDPFADDSQAQLLLAANDELNDSGKISDETLEKINNEMTATDVIEAISRVENNAPEGYFEDDSDSNMNQVEDAGLSDSDINDIQNAVGGTKAYEQMVSWAKDNFTPQEIQAYDNALEVGDMNNINLALQALYYRYTDSVGVEGDMIQGKAAAAVDGFRSQAEVVRAMGDPRYEDDPAYRQDIYNKLERSNIKF